MKAASLALFLLAVSPACWIVSGCSPTAAQPNSSTQSMDLSSRIGKSCSVRYPESGTDDAIVDGTLSQVTDQWLVISEGHRADILGTQKDSNEFWIRRDAITSIEFEGGIKPQPTK